MKSHENSVLSAEQYVRRTASTLLTTRFLSAGDRNAIRRIVDDARTGAINGNSWLGAMRKIQEYSQTRDNNQARGISFDEGAPQGGSQNGVNSAFFRKDGPPGNLSQPKFASSSDIRAVRDAIIAFNKSFRAAGGFGHEYDVNDWLDTLREGRPNTEDSLNAVAGKFNAWRAMVGKLMPQMSPEEALVKTGSLIKRISATPRYWSEKYTDSCELSEFLSELGRPLKKGRQEIIVDKLLKIEERVLAVSSLLPGAPLPRRQP